MTQNNEKERTRDVVWSSTVFRRTCHTSVLLLRRKDQQEDLEYEIRSAEFRNGIVEPTIRAVALLADREDAENVFLRELARLQAEEAKEREQFIG